MEKYGHGSRPGRETKNDCAGEDQQKITRADKITSSDMVQPQQL
jgi:hypothetical protein